MWKKIYLPKFPSEISFSVAAAGITVAAVALDAAIIIVDVIDVDVVVIIKFFEINIKPKLTFFLPPPFICCWFCCNQLGLSWYHQWVGLIILILSRCIKCIYFNIATCILHSYHAIEFAYISACI